SFLSSFLYLAREPIFAPFTWYLPSTLQPLHQTMILLVDLCDQPHSKDAQKSRAYIDDVFRLYPEHADTGGPTILLGDSIEMADNGAPASGSAAWRMLGRLRK